MEEHAHFYLPSNKRPSRARGQGRASMHAAVAEQRLPTPAGNGRVVRAERAGEEAQEPDNIGIKASQDDGDASKGFCARAAYCSALLHWLRRGRDPPPCSATCRLAGGLPK